MRYLSILMKKALPRSQDMALSPFAKAANSIKKELKAKFPGIKFSVRSARFAGGNSVDVSWDFGPTFDEVNELLYKYEKGSFDGMTDSYNYHKDPELDKFQEEHGSAKYVHAHRGYGSSSGHWFEDSVLGQIGRDLCEKQQIPYKGENTRGLFGSDDLRTLHEHVNIILNKSSLPSGWTYKGLGPFNENTYHYTLIGAK